MALTKQIRLRVPDELAARLARVAMRKQGTPRAVSSAGREALVQYVESAEQQLNLGPITPAEVEQYQKEAA